MDFCLQFNYVISLSFKPLSLHSKSVRTLMVIMIRFHQRRKGKWGREGVGSRFFAPFNGRQAWIHFYFHIRKLLSFIFSRSWNIRGIIDKLATSLLSSSNGHIKAFSSDFLCLLLLIHSPRISIVSFVNCATRNRIHTSIGAIDTSRLFFFLFPFFDLEKNTRKSFYC